jgi:hemerythrin-like domain-containing protein
MKRDPRLHGLTLDHNHALMLCTQLTKAIAEGSFDVQRGEALGELFDGEIEQHFRLEEELLLPALSAAGAVELVQRTEAEHATLRSLLQSARQGDVDAAEEFATALRAHVRFEEHELFAGAEEQLSDAQLAEVLRRAPKVSRDAPKL